MRRDFDSGRAMKISRALAEKTSLAAVPLTKLASSAASNSLPLPGGSGNQIRMREPVLLMGASQKFECSRTRESHFKDSMSLPAQENEKKAFSKSFFQSRRRRASHRS